MCTGDDAHHESLLGQHHWCIAAEDSGKYMIPGREDVYIKTSTTRPSRCIGRSQPSMFLCLLFLDRSLQCTDDAYMLGCHVYGSATDIVQLAPHGPLGS